MTSTKSIEQEATATLRALEKKDPGLKQLLNKAYGYAVFPSVGKASLVVGGSYGKGAVFCQGKFVGYATIGQTTIGVQIGGDTYVEVLVFEDRAAFDRLKRGKLAFAADASAVLVKAGAAAARGFGKGIRAFVYGKGGMLLEAVIGGQKFNFKPTGAGQKLMKKDENEQGQGRDEDQDEDQDADEDEGSAQDENEDSAGDDEDTGLATRAAEAAKSTLSGVTNFVKDHPVAAGAIGVGILAGGTLLVMRMMRSSDQSDDEDQQDQSDDSDEQDDDRQMSADDQESDQDEGDEEEEESKSRGMGRRRRFADAAA